MVHKQLHLMKSKPLPFEIRTLESVVDIPSMLNRAVFNPRLTDGISSLFVQIFNNFKILDFIEKRVWFDIRRLRARGMQFALSPW